MEIIRKDSTPRMSRIVEHNNTIYLCGQTAKDATKDMKDFAAMNEVWDAWVTEGHQPARACVEARIARPELLVELSVIAAKK